MKRKYSPDRDRVLEYFEENVMPQIKESAMTVAIIGNHQPDVKQCLELGASILLEKPIVILAVPGAYIPKRIREMADAIVEGDIGDPMTASRLQKAISAVSSRMKQ